MLLGTESVTTACKASLCDMDEIAKRKLLWDWTRRHIENGVMFREWLPTEGELTALGVELHMPVSKQNENRALMQMFLADEKYCKACEKCGYNSTCYLGGKRKTIVVINGNVSFSERECGKYARF